MEGRLIDLLDAGQQKSGVSCKKITAFRLTSKAYGLWLFFILLDCDDEDQLYEVMAPSKTPNPSLRVFGVFALGNGLDWQFSRTSQRILTIEELTAAGSHAKRPKQKPAVQCDSQLPEFLWVVCVNQKKTVNCSVLNFPASPENHWRPIRQSVCEVGNLPLGVFRIRGRN